MALSFTSADKSAGVLKRSIYGILAKTDLCSIATIKGKSQSYIHTAYFAYSKRLELFFLSGPQTQHCLNLKTNSSVAVAVYDSRQTWNRAKKGLQLWGSCAVAKGRKKTEAAYRYGKRFNAYRKWIASLSTEERSEFTSQFYVIKVKSMKIFDEAVFGEDAFVSLRLKN